MPSKNNRPDYDAFKKIFIRNDVYDFSFQQDYLSRNILLDLHANYRDLSVDARALISFRLAFDFNHHPPTDYPRSIQLLNETILLFPLWPEAYFNRAVSKIHVKDFDGAIADFEYSQALFKQDKETSFTNRKIADGKLLLFLAEARAGKGTQRDIEIARINILRAEGVLLSIHENEEADFWLSQVDNRILSTFSKNSAKEKPAFNFSRSSALGVITALIVLFLFFRIVTDYTDLFMLKN